MLKKYIYFLLIFVISTGLALTLGAVSLSSLDRESALLILISIRLPRVLGASLAGAALASAGTLLQCVTANELCAPNIIGINSGAGFGVITMLCFAPSLWILLPLAAFIGACLACGLIMGISFGTGKKTSTSTIVLCGVAVSSLLSAGISFLSLRYPDVLSSYTAFSVGGFSATAINDIAVPSIIIPICLILSGIISPSLDLLCLGDEMASSLGVRVRAVRITALLCACALCASAVSFAGLLGFVGLIVPHIIRRICGSDMRHNVILSALGGAILCVLSDLTGRALFAPTELPCGIIMAFIGAPFFIYLLVKRRYSDDRM